VPESTVYSTFYSLYFYLSRKGIHIGKMGADTGLADMTFGSVCPPLFTHRKGEKRRGANDNLDGGDGSENIRTPIRPR
jgi:hypothetical protein